MNILYEESGIFKAATVLEDLPTSYMAETSSGKRFKIKKNQVFMTFSQPDPAEMIAKAIPIADSLDIDFLWECAPEDETDYLSMAKDYFGQNCSAVEMAAMLIKLYGMPIYFCRKARGSFKKAHAENLKAALLGMEKRQKQLAAIEEMKAALLSGTVPETILSQLNPLLYKPDKNSVEYKALDAACQEKKTNPVMLLYQLGAIKSHYDYHLNRFLFDFFPEGTVIEAQALPEIDLSNLPVAITPAFSIDDETTTEFDDALSVRWLDNEQVEIGIHIAAPTLFVPPDTPIDQIARKRLSTVYMPGDKITMFPQPLINVSTLLAGKLCPALSYYQILKRAENDQFEMIHERTLLEKVSIEANLTTTAVEHQLEQLIENNQITEQIMHQPIATLYTVAMDFQAKRAEKIGKPILNDRIDYNFYVTNGKIRIIERKRGSPLDVMISEMMIMLNSRWATLLKEKEVTAIYRTQNGSKVKMSTVPASHSVLGVDCYGWNSSPLRRYVDFINQRQLLSIAQNQPPFFKEQDERLFAILQDFENVYSAYNDFQFQIERYWCLRWLEQESVKTVTAQIIKDQTARIDGVPLVIKSKSLPSGITGQKVSLQIESIDYWELNVYAKFLGLCEQAS